MNIKKSFRLIVFIQFLSILVFSKENTKVDKFDFNAYLNKRFGIKDITNITVKFHTKNQVLKIILETESDTSKAYEYLNIMWKMPTNTFIKEFYQHDKSDSSIKNGLSVKFYGDSSYYRQWFYKKGRKDSTWFEKKWDYFYIDHYKNGKVDGESVKKDYNGNIYYRQNFNNGIPIDTSCHWHKNGNLSELEIFDDSGNTILHKCYSEDGIEYECEGDYEYEDGVGELED